MPDFTLQITGATVQDWTDTAYPSRLNPHAGHPMKRYVATVGITVTLAALIGGVSPFDSTLAGKLFYAVSLEQPTPYVVGWSNPAGQSAVQSFVPLVAGHYLIYLRHDGGGAYLVHIIVETP
jgi:hypothetical protein